jgi:hypothetical protein
VLQAPPRLAINVMTLIIKVNTFMGRPPGRIQSAAFQMRVSPEFLKAVDKWRAKQEDKPSRAEAIRRLVEIGLKKRGGQNERRTHGILGRTHETI